MTVSKYSFELDYREDVIHNYQMSHTISIRITEDLLSWVKEKSERTGISQGEIIRQALERNRSLEQGFMELSGALSLAKNLSQRKGFSKS